MKKLLFTLFVALTAYISAFGQVSTATASNGQSYVIAVYNNNTYYALPYVTNAATYDAVEVTLNENNKVTKTDDLPIWKLTVGNSGDFRISYTNSTNTYFLNKSGTGKTNYNLKGATTGTYDYWSFTLSNDESSYIVKDVTTTASTSKDYLYLWTQGESRKFEVYGSGSNIILLEVEEVLDYTITAAVNNSEYGTVAISGTTITATPASGYRVSTTSPYTVTSGSATVTYNSSNNTFTVSASENCTIQVNFEAIPTRTITINSVTNGSLVVRNGENEVESGATLQEGTVLSIVATPNEGYKFRNLQVVDETTHTFTSSNTKEWTLGTSNITIKANFDEIIYRTITWSVNGNTNAITTASVADGEDITFPTNVDDILGKKFVGWSANANASSATDLASGQVAATEDKTYYAVFATVTPGSNTTAKLVCNATTEKTAYAKYSVNDDKGYTWTLLTNHTKKQDNNNVDHFYFGLNKSQDANYDKEVRNFESPEFPGNIVSIKAQVWNTSSSKRTAYLLSSHQGTVAPTLGDLGSMEISGNSKCVEQSFTLGTTAFNKFYIYSSDAIGFESIEVTFGTPDTYSNYTTTIASTTSITISAAAYSTYYNSEFAYTMPDDCEGYVFTAANGLEPIYEGGDVVPAGEPLVIYTIEPSTKTLVFTTSTEATYKSGDMNDLEGTDVETAITNDDAYYFYGLSLNAAGETSSVGFYWMNETGAAFTNGAHKAYLKLAKPAEGSQTQAPRRYLFNQTDTATDVEAVEAAEEVVKFFENGQLLIKKNGVVYNAMGQVIR